MQSWAGRQPPCPCRRLPHHEENGQSVLETVTEKSFPGKWKSYLLLAQGARPTCGGVAKAKFEAYALAASIVGKCHFCVKSHFDLLKKEGRTTQQLRDIGRIAAVVNAASQVIAAE